MIYSNRFSKKAITPEEKKLEIRIDDLILKKLQIAKEIKRLK